MIRRKETPVPAPLPQPPEKTNEPSLRERYAGKVTEACAYIARAETLPSLAELATLSGLSRYHFHRVFKSLTGLTPKAYAAAHRAQLFRERLTQGTSVTHAIYEAGFNSSGRVYESTYAMLGMTPTTYQAGGRHMQIRFAVGECVLGSILVAMSARGVCAILLGDDPEGLVRDLETRFAQAELVGGDTGFEQIIAKVVGLIEEPRRGLDLPLDLQGTLFQQRVWQALREIPAGATLSYTELAERLGEAKAVRAVAGACAANRLAVAIPCHRVVKKDGSISGYRWGVERKRALLARETDST